ncbi:SDR family NAD(P)-dependent oxidoreductase [Prochlorococcus marinus]|uniref:Short-chain dehydrogenase/reductase (SDR) superfamily n=1 Tax=Prochlorococcus marinus (strain MIT 9211) TaxID=93059 RepID=A9BA09_PROM4|nr:SDR family NAD(P)-dependent oxidoreductase [Prochlorococcus marinus]ABX08671.1 Short-chain dehydrogenase/reductase (SDR) superfamily [Prochlorococcus marinus str. MIT 9211]
MRTILISGANRGIGRKIAERAVKDGDQVSLGVRDSDQLIGTNLDPNFSRNKKILICKYESKSKQSAENWVRCTKNYFGKIDTLINCAGKFSKTKLMFQDNEVSEIEELWKTNVMGPWYLTRAAWEHLLEQNDSRVINLVSMSGKRSKGSLAAYTTTKFALMGLSQTIKNEGWEKGIRVTAICPGWVNTDMAKEVKTINKSDMTQPEDLAEIISTILSMPNSCVPFEISVNCNLERMV